MTQVFGAEKGAVQWHTYFINGGTETVFYQAFDKKYNLNFAFKRIDCWYDC